MGGGVEDRGFPGVLKKEVWKFQGSNRGVQEKLVWVFHGSWFLTLEFPRDVTQFCRFFRRESYFSPEFLRLNW